MQPPTAEPLPVKVPVEEINVGDSVRVPGLRGRYLVAEIERAVRYPRNRTEPSVGLYCLLLRPVSGKGKPVTRTFQRGEPVRRAYAAFEVLS